MPKMNPDGIARYAKNYLLTGVILLVISTLMPILAIAQTPIPFYGSLQVIGDKIEILTDTNANISLAAAIKSSDFKKTNNQFPNLDLSHQFAKKQCNYHISICKKRQATYHSVVSGYYGAGCRKIAFKGYHFWHLHRYYAGNDIV